jgi:hypothetical protein
MASELQAAIEQRWKERAKTQGLKPKSMAYKRAEVEFFSGAMTAIHATDPAAEPDKLSARVPVIWVINIMSGRPVVE